MSMGRKGKTHQAGLWLETQSIVSGPGHPFYQAVGRVLDKHGFESFVEGLCAPFYAEKSGRPSIAPGVYFRLLLIGYFEGLDSERGIAWRVADSLALRSFLGFALDQATPNHSSMSRIRTRFDLDTHTKVFQWVLTVLAKEHLLKGKTLGVDATTLEANAALRSIVRRDTGESYNQFLTELAKASGIPTPTREDLARLDRKRAKKGSNEEWEHPHDPDARIAKMKDGRTHLAHKAEHVIDMETCAVVAVTVQSAAEGDTTTVASSLEEATKNLDAVAKDPETKAQCCSAKVLELVADKGYHSNDVLMMVNDAEIRSYISEPARGRRNWEDKDEEQEVVYANRRRIRGARGLRLQAKRGEVLERANAHLYDTGGMRRTHLRGHENILKRLLVHTAAFNLGLLIRKACGYGTPRGLAAALLHILDLFLAWLRRYLGQACPADNSSPNCRVCGPVRWKITSPAFSTGC